MLRKKLLSILLALSLLAGTLPAAVAAEESAGDAMEPYLASLEPFTVTPVNPAAEAAEPQNLLDAPEAPPAVMLAGFEEDEPEEATFQNSANGERVADGAVLFALESGVSPDGLTPGLSDIRPLLEENGVALPFGEGQPVWYRAACAGDAAAAAKKLAALPGVAAAEPEYLYHADSFGEPEEAEHDKNWAATHLLKKSNKKWWWNEDLGHDAAPGHGTVVAVIDTGADYTHEDLAANMWTNPAELNGIAGVDDDGNGYIDDIYGVNVTASGTQAGDPMDDHGVRGQAGLPPRLPRPGHLRQLREPAPAQHLRERGLRAGQCDLRQRGQ